jgi:hypothetical protein
MSLSQSSWPGEKRSVAGLVTGGATWGRVRLGRQGEVRWQQVHDQLTAHFERLADGVAWFRGEHEPFGL